MPRVLNKYHGKVPADAIDIMRGTKWGNDWSHQPRSRAKFIVKTRAEAVIAHRLWFLTSDEPAAVELRRLARLTPAEGGLRGADCFCCCAPLPCHGDVLVEYANRSRPFGGR